MAVPSRQLQAIMTVRYRHGMTSKTHTGLYARQSKDKQKSIAEQIKEQRQDIAEQGWLLTEVYQDGVSASRFANKARPNWKRLIADIESGRINCVSLWESSRGDRTLTSWSLFLDLCRDRKIKIRVVTHARTYDMANAHDWEALAREGLHNAMSSEETSERGKRAHRAQARDGKPAGRKLYGYKRIYNDAGKLAEIVAHPEQAFYVAEAIRRVAEGESLYVIANDFNQVTKSPSGKEWSGTQIHRLCVNLAYIGIRTHKGEQYPAMWPALVDDATFYKAKHLVEDPRRKSYKDRSVKHLLTGIAECAVCDAKLDLVNTRGKHYYRCGKFHVSIAKADLDSYVDGYMRDVTTKLEARDIGQPRVGVDRESIKAQIAALRQQLETFLDEAVTSNLSASVVAGYETRVKSKIQLLEADMRSPYVPQIVYDLIQDPAVWINAGIEGQRTLVAELARVRVKRAGKSVGGFGAPVPVAARVSIEPAAFMGAITPMP